MSDGESFQVSSHALRSEPPTPDLAKRSFRWRHGIVVYSEHPSVPPFADKTAPGAENKALQVLAKMPCLASCRKYAVFKRWKGAGWAQLETHRSVIEPVSTRAGNGNFCCGDKLAKQASAKRRPPVETHASAKSPRSGAVNADRLMKVSTQELGGGRTRARTWDPMIKSLVLTF
jgi:hypothetical protein